MAENLRVTRYNDSTAIPLVTTPWTDLITPGYTWYNDTASDYGALYNFYAVASDSHNICPVGWHVPSLGEWVTLTNYLGGFTVAGGKLKEGGLAHWAIPNMGATNESGFAALPGGYIDFQDGFFSVTNEGRFWTSTVGGGNSEAWMLNIRHDIASAPIPIPIPMPNGLSVRCIKD